MTRTPVIPKARPDHPSLDFDVLRSEGVRHLENLATELWTDFNAHDPGITLLELLCYAITDLGYRSRMLPIGDLVAGSKEKAFFEALEILPSAPVTARDYRKLLIDVKGVKNAWVEKYGPTDQAKDLQVFASGSGIVFFEKLAINVQNKWVLKDDAVEKMTGFLEDFFPDAGAGALQNKLEQVQGWVTNGLDLKNDSIENQDLARAFTRRFGCIRFPLSKDYLDESTQIVYNGLVKITLDLDDHIDPENESQTRPVIQRAMRRLQANRTLCQDYVEPPVLVGKLPVAICLHLEVEPGKDAVEVAAEAIWRIEQHLRPILRFYTFREMRARGYAVEEIYNGPLLDNGFLDNLEVDAAQLLTEFHHSDLTNAATVKPGVDTVHELKVKVFNDAKFDIKTTYTIFKPETGNDSDPTPYNRTRPLKPVINLCESCILVTQNGFRRELSEAALQEPLRLKRLLAGCYDEPGGLETPTGIARPDLTEYRSLQYDLPGIYGVGDYNVSDETPADQKGRRKQLQAYLAFFDQILAAYLLQLGHIRQLLSVEQDPRLPTYLTADLRDIPGLMEVIDPDKSFSAESPATRADRRNRLLNHLLARFGETFSDFVVGILRADTGVEDNPFHQDFNAFLEAKANFLRELPGLGAERSKAYNYRGPEVWNTANVAGIKKRVHRLLGLKGSWHSMSLFTKPPYRLEMVTVRAKKGGLQHQIVFKVLPENLPPGTALPYSGILLRSKRFVSPKKAQDKREALNTQIWNKNHYSVDEHPRETSRQAVRFVLDGIPALYGEPLGEAEANELLEFIRDLVSFEPPSEKEGFHLLEHILLRPNDPNDDLLNISLGCDPLTSPRDPYSAWLSVLLPNWTAKFSNKQFQEYFEQTFRREMPAELAARFCWLDKVQMRRFEELFQAWLEAKAACTPDECHVTAAANALIDWLNNTPCSCTCATCCSSDSACGDCKEC